MSVAGFKFIFRLKINILKLNLFQKVGYIEEKNIFRLISAQFNVHICLCTFNEYALFCSRDYLIVFFV